MTRSAAQRAQESARKVVPPAVEPPAPVPPVAPPPVTAPDEAPSAETASTLELVLQEVRAVRDAQREVLDSLERLRRALPAALAARPESDDEAPSIEPIRARRRLSVLLLDDDPATREAARAELEKADVPVRAYDDGNAALAAIAEQKPDVIALELAVGGDMGGRDIVNLVKATMEWVDIPIILWTREPVAGLREARQLHGADELVAKAAGAAALVARVITLFRRP
jgi:CheY-like chemotaxis protein